MLLLLRLTHQILHPLLLFETGTVEHCAGPFVRLVLRHRDLAQALTGAPSVAA